MPVTVTVELLTGSYDAASTDDRTEAEWPPHPARLFCALVAAARGEADGAALTWLEAQTPPVVWAATDHDPRTRSAYVVTNTITASPGSQSHVGRTNGLRTRVHTVPASPRVRFVWEDAEPADGVVEALDAMTSRVPYLGRSTGVSLVSATATVDDREPAEAGWRRFEPCALQDAEVSLRVPYSGYLAELDVLHEAGRPAWEAARYRGYQIRQPGVGQAATSSTDQSPVVSPYPDLVVFRFAGLRPDGRWATKFTEALRSAVLRKAGTAAPPVLHGHGADGRPHVAFLALPHVGQEHAGGHLLGLAVAVPELPATEQRAVLAAVLGMRQPDGSATVELPVPGLGSVSLAYQPRLSRPWGATPERWRLPSRRWATATPAVLDRFPKKGRDDVTEILASCRKLGLPDPIDIQVSREPLLPGGVRMEPADLPSRYKGRLFRHVVLTFARPVAGPVLLGAGRYLGVGLLAPISEARTVLDGSGQSATPATDPVPGR